MAWAQPGSVSRQSRSTRPSWSVPSSSMSRCVLAVLVKELMPESIVKIFLNVGMMQDMTFHSFHSSFSWRASSRETHLLEDWDRWNSRNCVNYDMTGQRNRCRGYSWPNWPEKCWNTECFYKSVWSWSSNLDDSCVKTLQKSVTLFHKNQVHWNIISHLSMMGYFDSGPFVSCQEALLRETGEAERSLVWD